MESRGSVPEHDFSASLKQMIAAALICLFNYEEDMEDISGELTFMNNGRCQCFTGATWIDSSRIP